jgi:type IV pilus assembly protein PilX
MKTTMSRNTLILHRKQRGAALVVGLLLLLVITLLAISGMNAVSLELIMAGNEQYRQNAFQAAETGIELSLVGGAFVPGAADEVQANVAVPNSATDRYSSRIVSDLAGAAQPAIWGASWNSFSTYHFTVQSTGTSIRNSLANNVQGIAIIAPADPTWR